MLERLEIVFTRLRESGLKLKPSKCSLFQRKVDYLGHRVSAEGVETSPDKTDAVQNWPTPKNVHEVRSFLGLASYYRRFVQNFAAIARPMVQLTEKNRPFLWDDECDTAFETLKNRLVTHLSWHT
ncbi:uncharacterized protein [Ptychodera flava]|uniref:uncharacterized protein n=1 Tax=Ptychodera flava TaxID=63121 RepID=UPI00396A5CFD